MENAEEMREKANSIIKYHTLMSAGFGLIPVPYADMAAVAGTQINMIRELAKVYDVPFQKEYVRSAVAGILGGGLPFAASMTPFITSSLKAIPFVGQTLGAIVMPTLSTATTLALGRLFLRHFEAGGNLLNLNTDELRKHFYKEYETAKQDSKTLRDDETLSPI